MPRDTHRVRELRALIERHGIVFRGVQPKSEWPHTHTNLFQKIFDADRRWYSEFLQSESLSTAQKESLRKQIDQVVRTANSCRQDLDIESTWRMRIEKYISDRFEQETNCKECSNTTPGHGIRLLAQDVLDAYDFSSRPTPRRVCECRTSSNYEDSFDTGEVNIFNIKGDSKMLYMDHLVMRAQGVPETKPDCLIGLATTESMKRCIALRNDLRHYPFMNQNHRQLVYPFLLIEAKSEKGSPGFESIEAQSAFPIKTMLQIQAQLEDDPENPTNSLVWFIAYAGCDIRLYGCVKSPIHTIFELWHGSLMYHDKVFRLFHIIDLLCDWARDFRRHVQRCLVPNTQLRREITPASTAYSQEANHTNGQPSRFDILNEDLLMEIPSDDGDSLMEIPSDLSDSESSTHSGGRTTPDTLVEHADSFKDSSGRSRLVVVRHIDSVKLQFRHIVVPDKQLWTLSTGESDQLQQMMISALREARFITLSDRSMEVLEATWLEMTSEELILTPHIRVAGPCLLKLDMYFDPEDLLPVRSLTCVSMSIDLLRTIVGHQGIPMPNAGDFQGLGEHLAQEFMVMARSLNREDSIYSSLLGWEYDLVPYLPSTPEMSRNILNGPNKNKIFKFVEAIYSTRMYERSVLTVLPPGQQSTPIKAPWDIGNRQGIIVGRKELVRETSPSLGVLVMGEDVFDRSKIGRNLLQLTRTIVNLKDVYHVRLLTEEAVGLHSTVTTHLETRAEMLQLASNFHNSLRRPIRFQRSESDVATIVID